jgi:2-polyprenyl-3-methyl-5-hydroxy-6-metoxy-1,4-benzoquinol methylase
VAALLDEALADVVRDAGRSFAAQDDTSYYADNLRLLEPAYLRAETAEGGSGTSATPEVWRQNRGMIVDCLHRDGTFLDVGCANGLLMESVRAWAEGRGLDIEPYGVDLGPRLVALARTRLPQWAARIEVGNAIDYDRGRRFTFVHCLVDSVPVARRGDLIAHLRTLVEPGGRLLISVYGTTAGTGAAQAVDDCGWHADGEFASPSGRHTTAWIGG